MNYEKYKLFNFLSDYTKLDANGYTFSNDLVLAYNEFSKTQGRYSSKFVITTLLEMYGENIQRVNKEINGKRKRGFYGISLLRKPKSKQEYGEHDYIKVKINKHIIDTLEAIKPIDMPINQKITYFLTIAHNCVTPVNLNHLNIFNSSGVDKYEVLEISKTSLYFINNNPAFSRMDKEDRINSLLELALIIDNRIICKANKNNKLNLTEI